MERSFESAVRAVALGHAVADALGVPVEFMGRDELDAAPVTGMTGYGTYAVPAGSFSDDTSMALAALRAEAPVDIEGFEMLNESFPDFPRVLAL